MMVQDSKKHEIIKHSFFYTLSRYSAMFVNFFTAVLMRRFLGPFNTGIWNLLKVVIGYAGFVDLGSQTAVFYRIPFLKGKGELKKAQEVTDSVFNFAILATVVISLGVVVYAIFFKERLRPETLTGLAVVSFLLILQRSYTYTVVLLRANKDFDILSKSIIFDAVLNICLVLILVKTFKIYGLFAVVLILPVLNMLYISYCKNYNLRFTFKMPDILSHIKFGIPLFLSNVLRCILFSIDKIMIVSMLGFKQLGFYSIALMVRSYTEDISKNFEHIIIPYLLEDYGESEDVRKVSKYVTFLTLITSYIMSVLLSLAFILAPPFITYILPAFIPGIMAMKIFLLTTFFSGIAIYAFNYLVALNKQARVLPVIIFVILIDIIFNYLFIISGFGIAGVSTATSISAFFYFCVIFAYAMKHFANTQEILIFFLKVLFPLLYCATFLIGLEYFLKFENMILESFIKAGIFIVSIFPIIYLLNRQTNIISLSWSLISKRLFRGESR